MTLPTEQVPGIYHRRVGDVLVTALCDGYLDAPLEIFTNLEPEDADRVLKAGHRTSPPRISINCFLLRAGGRTAIVDNGSADSMGPTLGRLPEMLSLAGVSPEEIDTVLQTHLHPDHSNGLTRADGTRNFPNAEVVVSEADMEHWHDDATMARANERQRLRYFQWAREQIAPYRDRLKPAVGEVFPNVRAVPLPGHTPGHTGYVIEASGRSMIIWGDTCHIPDIQVPRPETGMIFDTDPAKAAETRTKTFDMIVADDLLIGGMHLHFPGFGSMSRERDGYKLVHESWAFTL